MKFIVKEKNLNLGNDIKLANDFFSRVKGLMFKKGLEGDGLLIKPCNSIHTFFMKFNIDVIFLDKSLKIVKIIKNLPPWRVTPIYFKACQVIEFEAGKINDYILEGDYLEEVCLN